MKTLIEIPRQIWGKVKDFATVKDISVNFAVEQLLTDGLIESGYILGKPEDGKERKLHEFEIGQAQNVTCEAAGKVDVKIGTQEAISLFLCDDCVPIFHDATQK